MSWLTAEHWPTFYFSFMLWRLRGEPWSLLVHLLLSPDCRKLFSSSMYPRKTSAWKRCCYFKGWLPDKQMLQRGSATTISCKRCVYFLFLLTLKLPHHVGITDYCSPTFCPVSISIGRGCLKELGWRDTVTPYRALSLQHGDWARHSNSPINHSHGILLPEICFHF